MRLTRGDGIATLLVAAIVVPYAGYLAWGSMPYIQDPEGMAGVGLVFGLAGAAFGGWVAVRSGVVLAIATLGTAVVSLGLGITTVVTHEVLDTGVRDGLLAAFVATIVALWALATLRHLSAAGPASTSGPARA
jgi:hypothetical protein